MAKDGKLQALQTSCEIDEQQAFERKRKVDDIVVQRQKLVDELAGKRTVMLKKLQKLEHVDRGAALLNGDALRLSAISRYSKRLSADIERLSAEFEERTQELRRALERARLAEQALIDARIEKKKIEKFIENRRQTERVHNAAMEEDAIDELNLYRRTR
ncbi:MAG TPA: hypothetical protein PLP17_13915 [Oligoflexia bacterium]|nr:hypothetical protein [Oligoflexia bacterium]